MKPVNVNMSLEEYVSGFDFFHVDREGGRVETVQLIQQEGRGRTGGENRCGTGSRTGRTFAPQVARIKERLGGSSANNIGNSFRKNIEMMSKTSDLATLTQVLDMEAHTQRTRDRNTLRSATRPRTTTWSWGGC